jgi:Na+-driven multidrug efflux pump
MSAPAVHRGDGSGRGMRQVNGSRILSLVKAWIVRLALWGWLPYGLATWLIQKGGMRHE